MEADLYVDVRNPGAGLRLALVHGFTQSTLAWAGIREDLSDEFETVALDAPGHGRSADVKAGLRYGAELMTKAVLAAGSGGPAVWVGYSMGGRFALHIALANPRAVTGLVLVSTTAGIDDPSERSTRRTSDAALAEQVERDGLERFVAWWLAQPIFSSLPVAAANIESRLGGSAAGLASSLRLAGSGTFDPLWESLHDLEMPVLVVAGELDSKYCLLARRLVDAIGANADLLIIPGSGHACHLERPDEFVKGVTNWIARLRSQH